MQTPHTNPLTTSPSAPSRAKPKHLRHTHTTPPTTTTPPHSITYTSTPQAPHHVGPPSTPTPRNPQPHNNLHAKTTLSLPHLIRHATPAHKPVTHQPTSIRHTLPEDPSIHTPRMLIRLHRIIHLIRVVEPLLLAPALINTRQAPRHRPPAALPARPADRLAVMVVRLLRTFTHLRTHQYSHQKSHPHK